MHSIEYVESVEPIRRQGETLEEFKKRFTPNLCSGTMMSMAWRREAYKEIASMLNLKLCWNEEIKPGDFYIGMRNRAAQIFICDYVHKEYGYVVSIPEKGIVPYPYDIYECCKVIEMES